MRTSMRSVLVVLAVAAFVGPATPLRAQGTWRISFATERGRQPDDDSLETAISADGRFIAFTSDASNLVLGDTNGERDIFLHDRQTGTTTLVSLDSLGGQGTLECYHPSVSGDGSWVAFESRSTFVQGDSNNTSDIFVRDVLAGRTYRASVHSDGSSGSSWSVGARLSADGRFVGYTSAAPNLVDGDTNQVSDAFVHDLTTRETFRVSLDSSGNEAHGYSYFDALSADGGIVLFQSLAADLVASDTNNKEDVFVHDRSTGETTRVSVDSSGNEGNGHSLGGTFSADGRCVAFLSAATNLVPGDTNAKQDAFVHDRVTGETTRVSVSSTGGEANGSSSYCFVSADGRWVVFQSSADNLVPGDTNARDDVFLHDRLTGETTRVSVASDGSEAETTCGTPSISADGRFVAFVSPAKNLVEGDFLYIHDVFVHGPYLTLSAEQESVAAGEDLVLTAWSGERYARASLRLEEWNDLPVQGPILPGRFDLLGRFTKEFVVPPGLSGSRVAFRAVGLTERGLFEWTNRETITIE